MLVERVLAFLPIESTTLKLFLGAILVALAISLASIGAMHVLGIRVNPALTAALSAAGTAAFIARHAGRRRRR